MIKKRIRFWSLLARKWWRVMKGPPPKKHGVIPYDREKGFVENVTWLNSKIERPYLHDYSLCLRPGLHDRKLSPAVQIKPIPRNKFPWEIDCESAGWKPQPLESNYD